MEEPDEKHEDAVQNRPRGDPPNGSDGQNDTTDRPAQHATSARPGKHIVPESNEKKKVTFVTGEEPEESPKKEEEPVTRKPGRTKGSKTTSTDKTTTIKSARVFTRSRKKLTKDSV